MLAVGVADKIMRGARQRVPEWRHQQTAIQRVSHPQLAGPNSLRQSGQSGEDCNNRLEAPAGLQLTLFQPL
ncbi:hypothetical protein JK621_11610 [Serratia plymuthica]|uniref:hypothetical protein n=1 Tax=Serratia plymuthica TaxID=82996 RepID=UPI001BAF386A|nr:hypothetical protein [Serratia plymuthica]QUY50746.1 hypothetical protein JK621_11610 [Serratia plymuthica]